jgi:hypothetical protein
LLVLPKKPLHPPRLLVRQLLEPGRDGAAPQVARDPRPPLRLFLAGQIPASGWLLRRGRFVDGGEGASPPLQGGPYSRSGRRDPPTELSALSRANLGDGMGCGGQLELR